MSSADVATDAGNRQEYAVSVRRMTAESVAYVLLGGAVAISGFVIGAQLSWWLGIPIMFGAVPLWGWGCLANRTFYAEP